MKFEVLAGVHSEGGKIFRKGEVVDSISDLDRFNPVGIPPKFRKVDDSTKPTHLTTHNVKAAAAAAEVAAAKAEKRKAAETPVQPNSDADPQEVPKKRTVIVKPKRVIKTADTTSED